MILSTLLTACSNKSDNWKSSLLTELSELPKSNEFNQPKQDSTLVIGLQDTLDVPGSVTLDLVNVTLSEALDSVLTPFSISYVIDSSVSDSSDITLSFSEASILQSLKAISNSTGTDLRFEDGILRATKSGIESVALVPPLFGGLDAASNLARSVATSLTVTDIEGTLVVSGDASDVKRFNMVSDQLSQRPPGQWAVEIWIISNDSSSIFAGGLSVSPGFNAILSGGTDLPTATVANFLVSLEAQLNYGSTGAELVSKTSLILLENRPTTVSSTVNTPIPTRTVSPQGTVQTTGYEYIKSGLILNLTGKPVSSGLECSIRPTISNIQGFSEFIPIVAERSTSCSFFVRSGSFVVISGMETLEASSSYDIPTFFSKNSKNSRLTIIAKFDEIGY